MVKRPTFRELVKKLTPEERIERAKFVTEELTRRISLPLSLHEANKIIGYTDTLSSQIPPSYAGHAFRDLCDAMFRYEIVQLLSLWEKPDGKLDNTVFSLPTVAQLVDHDDVIGRLSEQHFDAHKTRETRFVNLPSEPDMKRSALEMFKNHQVQFAIEQANQCDLRLRCSIEEVNDTLEAPYFIGLQNFRHKVSHSLSKTRLEQRRDIAIPVKYGFETELLSTSTKLIEQFYSWINGISFSIEDDCRDFAKKCAEDLWHNCHFTIER